MDIAMPARMMRLWTARTRIACFLALAMPSAAFARTIVVPPQPVSPYADTEVSTNCVLHRSRIDARTFDVHFQFEGTPTNNLEVAFGRDSKRTAFSTSRKSTRPMAGAGGAISSRTSGRGKGSKL